MPSRDPFELVGEQASDLIDQVAAFGPPAPLFVLTGGDPLKRPDLLDLISHASSRKLPVALSPSGTPLLTRNESFRSEGRRTACDVSQRRRRQRRGA